MRVPFGHPQVAQSHICLVYTRPGPPKQADPALANMMIDAMGNPDMLEDPSEEALAGTTADLHKQLRVLILKQGSHIQAQSIFMHKLGAP